MKKIISNLMLISAVVIAIMSFNSCSSEDDLIDDVTVYIPFSIPTNTNVDIPFAVSTEYVDFPEMPLNLDLDTKIKTKFPALTIDNLKSADLTSFSIDYLSSPTDTDPNPVNFKKVLNAELWIKTPELAKMKIATALNNASETSLNFTPVAEADLKDYLKSPNASLILRVQGTEVATTQMKTRVNSSFTVEIGL